MQLLTELREAYTRTKEGIMKLKRSKGFDKIANLEEFLKYPVVASSAAIKIQAKGVVEAKEIARGISKQFSASPIYDERQIGKFITPAYDKLIKILEVEKEHAEVDHKKSKALIRMIRQARIEVWRERKRSVKLAKEKIKGAERQAQSADYEKAA
tara:strand:- start:1782 stop:2246 length:465 start_codon:yes stop_codon:yes gene_type:complete